MACIWTLHGLEASSAPGAYMAEKLTELEHTPGVGANGGTVHVENFLEDLQSQEYATVAEEGGDVAYRSPPIRKLGPCLLSFGLFRGDILPHPQARNYPKIHRSFGGGRCCVPSARTLCTSSEVCLLKKALILQLKQKAEELSCHSSRTEFLRASSSQHNLRDSSGLCSESFILTLLPRLRLL